MDFKDKLSNISKKVSDGVVDTYKVVSDKTGEIVSETKHRFTISSKQDDIKDMYLEIGKETYELYSNGENLNDNFTKKCKKIEKNLIEIEEIEKLILFNKDQRICLKCNKVIPLNSLYCEFCGEKQGKVKIKKSVVEDKTKVKKEDELPKERVCPECGDICNNESLFCKVCGHKF